MKLKINLLLIIAISTFLSSCDNDGYADYTPGETNTQELSGEWYIVAYNPDGEPEGDYHLWSTYNTAQNNDSLWIDDHASWQEDAGLKTRVQADLEDLTFSGPENAPELHTDGTVTVRNGQIIKDGGRAAGSGNVVDSIYFEAEFDWDPGTVYTFGGHARTGFDEDDNPSIH